MKAAVKWITLWAGLAFAFHLAWEIAHLPLYGLWSDNNTSRIAVYVLHCTVGDVLLATSAFLVVCAALRRMDWAVRVPWLGGLLVVTAGLGYTTFSEWYNVYQLGSWSYTAAMPLVAGIGLTPLLQWLVVPSIMVIVMRRLSMPDAPAYE